MWARLIELIKKWFKKDDPEPEPNSDAIQLSEINWLGPCYESAAKTAALSAADMDKHFLYLGRAAPERWPKKVVKVTVQGITCIFYTRKGKIVGGKFDWLRPGQTEKTLENLEKGYNGHSMPRKGSNVYTMSVSVDGRDRTNIVKVKWNG
jgi:hypothetical protein